MGVSYTQCIYVAPQRLLDEWFFEKPSESPESHPAFSREADSKARAPPLVLVIRVDFVATSHLCPGQGSPQMQGNLSRKPLKLRPDRPHQGGGIPRLVDCGIRCKAVLLPIQFQLHSRAYGPRLSGSARQSPRFRRRLPGMTFSGPHVTGGR